MASLDWSQCPAVESIPGKVSGAWVFRDTRLPVATVIENLEDLSVEEVMEQFDVTREQITAVLEFVAQSLRVSPRRSIRAHGRCSFSLTTERPHRRSWLTLKEGDRTMANLDWSQCLAVESVPGRVSGAWTSATRGRRSKSYSRILRTA